MIGLKLLDILLTLVHLVVVGFNMFGWIWKRTRKLHFIGILVTAGCWFILGIWYGIGYCPITDWQWQVKEKLGERNLPNSFIKYMADKITGTDVSTQLMDILIAGGFVVAFILSIYLNFLVKRKKQSVENYKE
jgi:hypothetical protein